MIPILFDLLYLPVALVYLPILIYRMVVTGKSRRDWGQRFGGSPIRSGSKKYVWIHGVSLGEINATRTLVKSLLDRGDVDVCVSSTTDTGNDAAKRLYPDLITFRFPIDFSFAVKRSLRRIRPDLIVLMELETWPNFLQVCESSRIPVAVANGRITEEKSMRRYSLPVIRSIAGRMFKQLSWVAAQDETYADRFRRLGVDPNRVHTVGSIKYDTAEIADHIPGDAALADAMKIDRNKPLIVAGSTGPDEEAILIDVWEAIREHTPNCQLAIIPRKPERFNDVARLIESRGFTCIRRSERPDGSSILSDQSTANRPAIFLGDTMGELRKFYSLADVVFVGRSLVPMGGSDLMEVAALGKPMVYGQHVWNFEEIDKQLIEADAARKAFSNDELQTALVQLLGDRLAATAIGERARGVVARNQGATKAIVELVQKSIR